jgi:hypothetical protein
MLDWDDTRVRQLMGTSNRALGRFLQERNKGGLLPAFFGEKS